VCICAQDSSFLDKKQKKTASSEKCFIQPFIATFFCIFALYNNSGYLQNFRIMKKIFFISFQHIYFRLV